MAARTVCPASCRGSGRLVSLGSVEKGRKMMSSSGRVRVQGRKAESSTKKKRRRKRSDLGQSREEREVVGRGGGKEAWKKVGGRES